METKQIIIIEKEKKEIIPKEIKKRKITTTDIWYKTELQQKLIHQQIKNKIHSYRSQDIEKNILDIENLADLSGVLQKLADCNHLCYYCKEPILLLYENVRDPKQWTLERINNKIGHVIQNVEIACLSCNLRRRTMKPERYILTKAIKIVVKKNSEFDGLIE